MAGNGATKSTTTPEPTLPVKSTTSNVVDAAMAFATRTLGIMDDFLQIDPAFIDGQIQERAIEPHKPKVRGPLIFESGEGLVVDMDNLEDLLADTTIEAANIPTRSSETIEVPIFQKPQEESGWDGNKGGIRPSYLGSNMPDEDRETNNTEAENYLQMEALRIKLRAYLIAVSQHETEEYTITNLPKSIHYSFYFEGQYIPENQTQITKRDTTKTDDTLVIDFTIETADLPVKSVEENYLNDMDLLGFLGFRKRCRIINNANTANYLNKQAEAIKALSSEKRQKIQDVLLNSQQEFEKGLSNIDIPHNIWLYKILMAVCGELRVDTIQKSFRGVKETIAENGPLAEEIISAYNEPKIQIKERIIVFPASPFEGLVFQDEKELKNFLDNLNENLKDSFTRLKKKLDSKKFISSSVPVSFNQNNKTTNIRTDTNEGKINPQNKIRTSYYLDIDNFSYSQGAGIRIGPLSELGYLSASKFIVFGCVDKSKPVNLNTIGRFIPSDTIDNKNKFTIDLINFLSLPIIYQHIILERLFAITGIPHQDYEKRDLFLHKLNEFSSMQKGEEFKEWKMHVYPETFPIIETIHISF